MQFFVSLLLPQEEFVILPSAKLFLHKRQTLLMFFRSKLAIVYGFGPVPPESESS